MIKNKSIIINHFIYFASIIISLIISNECYVLIQLKQFSNSSLNNDYSPELLIKNLFNQYYSFLNVGNPPQKTEIQISSEEHGLIMKENICLTSNYYNKSKSLSFNEIYYTDKNQTIIVNETVNFPIFNSTTNKLTYQTIPDYNYIYYKSDIDENACIILGFRLKCKVGMSICNNIPSYLKRSELTSAHNYLFLFHNDKEKKENGGYDASLIIGENPHDFNKKRYHEKNYIQSKALYWLGDLTWTLRYKNYYYYNGKQINFNFTRREELIHGIFLYNLDIIIGIKDYLLSIKSNYFDKYQKECKINIVDSQYTVITCDKNFNTEKFPTLYFYHMDYNYTFELTHKDLFQIKGDKKYFLIIFDSDSNYPWKFGKIFLQKYLFNFDTDSKTIGFYTDLNNDSNYNESEEIDNNSNSNSDDNNNKSLNFYLWILWGVLLIITGIGCFFLGKILYDKNRKKRANELDDDYEHKQNNNEESLTNNSKNNKLGIN